MIGRFRYTNFFCSYPPPPPSRRPNTKDNPAADASKHSPLTLRQSRTALPQTIRWGSGSPRETSDGKRRRRKASTLTVAGWLSEVRERGREQGGGG